MAEFDWKIAKSSPECGECRQPFRAAEPYFSLLLQKPEGLTRRDLCAGCFKASQPESIYYYWKTTLPTADGSQRRPIVDVDYIFEFFKKLQGDANRQSVVFRYILSLMLARKKILISDSRKRDSMGQEIQVFRERPGGELHEVVEPELSPEEIEAVSTELGILLGLPPAPGAPAAEVSAEAAASAPQPLPDADAPEMYAAAETGAGRRT